MKALLISVILASVVSGCATPEILLQNEAKTQIVKCGGGFLGSLAGGRIGYEMERDSDAACVRQYEAGGFRRIN